MKHRCVFQFLEVAGLKLVIGQNLKDSLDFLKRAGRNPVQNVADPEMPAGPGSGETPADRVPAPESRLESQEIAAITQEVLAELPEIFRTVLVLREFEAMAYQDMADLLGISIGTVESRLFRARARFRDAMLRLHPEYAENGS